jgi:hypothetical protein
MTLKQSWYLSHVRCYLIDWQWRCRKTLYSRGYCFTLHIHVHKLDILILVPKYAILVGLYLSCVFLNSCFISVWNITQPQWQMYEIRVWNDNLQRKTELLKKSLSQWHFVHYKYHTSRPAIAPGLLSERLKCSQSFYVTTDDGRSAETYTTVTISCSTQLRLMAGLSYKFRLGLLP